MVVEVIRSIKSLASESTVIASSYLAQLPQTPIYAMVHTTMTAILTYLPYLEITLSVLLILGIVLQQRGASIGGAFGGDNFSSTFYKRRGAEKFLFSATIVLAVLFTVAAIVNFLIAF